MTISARKSVASITYDINSGKVDSGTVYNVTFPFLNNEEYLTIWYRNNKQEEKQLILDTDYSIELENGTNNIYGACIILHDITDINSLTIERKIENNQDVNFTSDTLYSSTTEFALDKLTALIQDLNFKNYALRAPNDEKLVDSGVYELPPTTGRINKILGFGTDGLPELYDKVEGGVSSPATKTALGLVMIGDNLTVSNIGRIDVYGATKEQKGVVKIGDNIDVSNDNVISIPSASRTVKGVVKIGPGIKVNDGEISVTEERTLTPGDNIKITNDNVISATYADPANWEVNFKPDDGITWTATTMPSLALWTSVCYGGDKYVAVAEGSAKAAYSTDGITWTAATLPSTEGWSSVCYGGGKFVAVIADSNVAAYSTDGITWTSTTMPSLTLWSSVCYGGDKYVAVAEDSDKAAYSTDGITWTAANLPVQALWTSVCYGGDKYVAVAEGSAKAAYSTDGITWKAANLPVQALWTSVCYGEGKFVAVARGSDKAAYSVDGINWTESPLPSQASWVSVCYGNGKFIAGGSGTRLIPSTVTQSVGAMITKLLQKIGGE